MRRYRRTFNIVCNTDRSLTSLLSNRKTLQCGRIVELMMRTDSLIKRDMSCMIADREANIVHTIIYQWTLNIQLVDLSPILTKKERMLFFHMKENLWKCDLPWKSVMHKTCSTLLLKAQPAMLAMMMVMTEFTAKSAQEIPQLPAPNAIVDTPHLDDGSKCAQTDNLREEEKLRKRGKFLNGAPTARTYSLARRRPLREFQHARTTT